MQVKHPRDIGREARTCRRILMLRQHEVARAVGVSRQWLSALEKGKATLELGLVLRAFDELGLEITVTRAAEPPIWTRPFTADAEMREARTLFGRRRRRFHQRQRERDIREGNLAVD